MKFPEKFRSMMGNICDRRIKLYFISYRRDRARPCPNLIYPTSDSRKGCPYGCM